MEGTRPPLLYGVSRQTLELRTLFTSCKTLTKTYHPSGKLPYFALMDVTIMDILPCRSVKELAEDREAEVHVCKPDLWRDAANRFPDLSVG